MHWYRVVEIKFRTKWWVVVGKRGTKVGGTTIKGQVAIGHEISLALQIGMIIDNPATCI